MTTTAQGPMQHSPINDANALIPIAPPVVAAVVVCDSVDNSLSMFVDQSIARTDMTNDQPDL